MVKKQGNSSWVAKVGLATSIPGVLFATTLVGYLIGSWLDGKYGWDPWGTALFSIFGVVAGFVQMIKILAILSR